MSMLTRGQDTSLTKNQDSQYAIWRTFVGPLVAALIAGAGAFIGMQREMSVVTNSVNRMTSTVEKIADKQTTFFESFYVPLALKVEQQGSSLNNLSNTLNNMKDEMRYLHPARGYK